MQCRATPLPIISKMFLNIGTNTILEHAIRCHSYLNFVSIDQQKTLLWIFLMLKFQVFLYYFCLLHQTCEGKCVLFNYAIILEIIPLWLFLIWHDLYFYKTDFYAKLMVLVKKFVYIIRISHNFSVSSYTDVTSRLQIE